LSPPIMAGNGAGGLTSSVMYVISSIWTFFLLRSS
jgi:hypothetical protein